MTSTNRQDSKKTFCDEISLAAFTMLQSYGSLLVLDRTTLKILQYSENAVHMLNVPNLLLRDCLISDFLSFAHKSDDLNNWLTTANKHYGRFIWKGKEADLPIWVYIHQQAKFILLEIELAANDDKDKEILSTTEEVINLAIDIKSKDLNQSALQLCQALVGFTGCERAVLYYFEEDNSGLVIAESTENMDPLLGLRFPATDIPKNVRAMFLRQPLRYIPNINGPTLTLSPNTTEKIDLSEVILRAASPIHLEYMRNMGVNASLSVAIHNDNNLWGLIVCHYSKPQIIPINHRLGVLLLSDSIGRDLVMMDKKRRSQAKKAMFKSIESMQHMIQSESTLSAALEKVYPDLLKLFSAVGMVYCYHDQIRIAGQTPSESQIRDLMRWLIEQHNLKTFTTQDLSHDYPPSIHFDTHFCGLLAIPNINGQNWLMFFRNEYIEETIWAGDPDDVLIQKGNTYSPRASFAAWKKTVHNQSLKWESFEVDAALALIQTLTMKQLQ